jgi:hypothetical protein
MGYFLHKAFTSIQKITEGGETRQNQGHMTSLLSRGFE